MRHYTRLEEGLKRFQPLLDVISKQISQGDESNVLALLRVQEIAIVSAMKLAKLGDRDAEEKYRIELEAVRAEIRRREAGLSTA